MSKYTSRGYRRRRRRARIARAWDNARPFVFMTLVAAGVSCAWYLGHLAGLVD